MTDLTQITFKPPRPGNATIRARGAPVRQMTIRMDEELFMALKRRAMNTGRTLSQAVRVILRARLAKPPRPHLGDPCIHCGTPHDQVAAGPCRGRAITGSP